MASQPPGLTPAGTSGIGPQSPIQQAIRWINRLLAANPTTDLNTVAANETGALAGTHLLQLMLSCGQLNGYGYHSAAVCLFRPMEDALDTFAAVTLVQGAAERWQKDDLKASDAAKQWIGVFPDMVPKAGVTLSDYRRLLRDQFNQYTHCSIALCKWNLFFNPTGLKQENGLTSGSLDLNFRASVIDRNGHSIDAYETAHMLEFIMVIQRAYSKYLSANLAEFDAINGILPEINLIMLKHDRHNCQDVSIPPEMRRIRFDQN